MACWLRASAVYVALFAMAMRAVIPVGWMPNPTGSGAPLVLCTMDGPVPFLFGPDGKPLKHAPSDRDHHSVCPYNAAPHFAVAASAAVLVGRPTDYVPTQFPLSHPASSSSRRHEPQSARAPPSVV
jgi:hypothetical protein